MGLHLENSQTFAEGSADQKPDQIRARKNVAIPTTARNLAGSSPVLQSNVVTHADIAMHLLHVAEIAQTDGDIDLANSFVVLAYELLDGVSSVSSATAVIDRHSFLATSTVLDGEQQNGSQSRQHALTGLREFCKPAHDLRSADYPGAGH